MYNTITYNTLILRALWWNSSSDNIAASSKTDSKVVYKGWVRVYSVFLCVVLHLTKQNTNNNKYKIQIFKFVNKNIETKTDFFIASFVVLNTKQKKLTSLFIFRFNLNIKIILILRKWMFKTEMKCMFPFTIYALITWQTKNKLRLGHGR